MWAAQGQRLRGLGRSGVGDYGFAMLKTPPGNPLDRPVWSALSTRQAALSRGGDLARRYQPEVNMFAAAADDSAAALEALAALVPAGDEIFTVERAAMPLPPGLEVAKAATVMQLVAARRVGPAEADEFVALSATDSEEMVALATLTEPGPFRARTHEMGQFFGVRIDGRLAAMAGERMRVPGFTEISGVCTHPDFRGRGLARALSRHVAAQIEARGETPFLHSWSTNAAAISLYESLGFVQRCDLNVTVLARP